MLVLTEEDLMARICAMVPPPRFHLTRYAGVLAPNAKLRAEVVPGRRRDEELAVVDERSRSRCERRGER